MAERRMFAKSIVTSDAFLDMPMSARCLYFTLGMFADDDGFVNSPKSIMRQVGATNDDMGILVAKKFIIGFENGVIVIKHWRINNYLQKDRCVETKYTEEKARLIVEQNGSYTLADEGMYTACIQDVYKPYTQGSIVKDSIVKDSIGSSGGFTPPTPDEVNEYSGGKIDGQHFVDYYNGRNWMVGRNKMGDWKSIVNEWIRTEKPKHEGSFDTDEFFAAALERSYK